MSLNRWNIPQKKVLIQIRTPALSAGLRALWALGQEDTNSLQAQEKHFKKKNAPSSEGSTHTRQSKQIKYEHYLELK